MLFKKKIPKRRKGIDGLERKQAFQEKKFQNAGKPSRVGPKTNFSRKKDPKPVQDSRCLDVNLSKYSFYVQKNEFYNVFWT